MWPRQSRQVRAIFSSSAKNVSLCCVCTALSEREASRPCVQGIATLPCKHCTTAKVGVTQVALPNLTSPPLPNRCLPLSRRSPAPARTAQPSGSTLAQSSPSHARALTATPPLPGEAWPWFPQAPSTIPRRQAYSTAVINHHSARKQLYVLGKHPQCRAGGGNRERETA